MSAIELSSSFSCCISLALRELGKHVFLFLILLTRLIIFGFRILSFIRLSSWILRLCQWSRVRWFIWSWNGGVLVGSFPRILDQNSIFHLGYWTKLLHFCMEIYLCSDCSEELLKNLPVFLITMQSYWILRQLVVPQRSLLTFPQFPQVLEEGVKLSMEALFF